MRPDCAGRRIGVHKESFLVNQSRTTRFVQNTLSTAVYQLTAMLLGFVTPRLMILYYGSEVNGLIVSVTEFLSYFKMVESGLAAAANAALYGPLARRDMPAVNGIVSAARRFYHAAGWFFTAITVVFAAVYPLFIPVHNAAGSLMSHLSVMALILALGVSGALEFFTMARFRVLLTADQRTYVVSLTSMASLLLSTALIVVLPYLGLDVITVRLAGSLTILVRSVLLSRYVKRFYPEVNAFVQPDRSALSKRWDALYMELTNVFQQGAGVIFGTIVTRDAGILSVYGVYHMVTVGLWGVLKMATTGIYSIFGNLMVSEKKESFQRAYTDFECLYDMAVTILFGVATVLIVPFVNLYTHGIQDVNYNVPLLGMLIIVEGLTTHMRIPLNLMISASGKFREVRGQCLAQVLTTTGLSVVLGLLLLPMGPEASLCGILVGVSLSNVLRAILLMRLVPSQITGLSWKPSARRSLRMCLTVALIATPCLILIDAPRRFFTWVMYAAMLVLYATIVTLAVNWLMDRRAMRSLIGRAGYLLRRFSGR